MLISSYGPKSLGRQSQNANRLLAGRNGFRENLKRPATLADPINKQISSLSPRLTEMHCAARSEVMPPEGLLILPLRAFVQNVGANDYIELLGQSIGLPVQFPSSYAR